MKSGRFEMQSYKHDAQASGSARGTRSLARRAYMSMALLLLLTPIAIRADEIDFNRDVRPILADNCFECHGPDEESREADLRFDVLDDAVGWVIDPGKPEKSSLIARLLSSDPHEVMPPPEAKRRPTARQIEILREWIAQGAKYKEHWAFAAPK